MSQRWPALSWPYRILAALSALLAVLIYSPRLITILFATEGFAPHGHPGLWQPELIWLSVGSDAMIGLAYVAISGTLVYFVHRTRHSIPFQWMFLAFGSFIIACGMTHFMEVILVWAPVYWFAGLIKVLTALVSVGTAMLLPPLLPKTLSLIEAARASSEHKGQLELAVHDLSSEIDEHRRTTAELQMHSLILQTMAEGVSLTSANNARIIYVNPKCADLFGYAAAELIGNPLALIYSASTEDQSGLTYQIQSIATLESSTETQLNRQDGTIFWCRVRRSSFEHPHYGPVWIDVYENITERKQAEATLQHQALHDTLTGLPNRTFFINQLSKAIELRQRNGTFQFSLLFLDLDHFKLINDSLGHGAGDQLLIEIAQRLLGAVRADDCVARFGGDEFVVLLNGIGTAQEASTLADRVHEALRTPFKLDASTVTSSVSIGIMVNTDGYVQVTDLLRDADMALYRAKAAGRARSVIFSRQSD